MSELLIFEPWVKVIGGMIAAGAAIVATFKALAEWRRANEQRKEELLLRQREFRQGQAIFAWNLEKEIFNHEKARAALTMLDWLRKEHTDEEGETFDIQRSELQKAMRTTDLKLTKKEVFIRTRFEVLYDYLEQVENLIELEVINFEDIETTFRYYMTRALRPNIQHSGFLDYYDYPKSRAFLRRFEKRTRDSCEE